jgi:hypothetical protein
LSPEHDKNCRFTFGWLIVVLSWLRKQCFIVGGVLIVCDTCYFSEIRTSAVWGVLSFANWLKLKIVHAVIIKKTILLAGYWYGPCDVGFGLINFGMRLAQETDYPLQVVGEIGGITLRR